MELNGEHGIQPRAYAYMVVEGIEPDDFRGAGYILWIGPLIREWMSLKGRESVRFVSEEDRAEFDRWLFKKYSLTR